MTNHRLYRTEQQNKPYHTQTKRPRWPIYLGPLDSQFGLRSIFKSKFIVIMNAIQIDCVRGMVQSTALIFCKSSRNHFFLYLLISSVSKRNQWGIECTGDGCRIYELSTIRPTSRKSPWLGIAILITDRHSDWLSMGRCGCRFGCTTDQYNNLIYVKRKKPALEKKIIWKKTILP